MTPQNQLSVEGNFYEHPFAELVAEISHATLDGSLRLSHGEQKCVVYFKRGKIAFAVSNSRASRLVERVLEHKRFSKEDLAGIENIANDVEFADGLVNKNLIDSDERNKLFADQINGILVDALTWPQGDWTFSSLARIRDGLSFEIESEKLLIEYARCLPVDAVLGRFRSTSEAFVRSSQPNLSLILRPEEIEVLAIFTSEPWSAKEVTGASRLPEAVTIHSLYSLWLAGLLERLEWKPAFPKRSIAAMRGAKLELKQEAQFKPGVTPAVPVPSPTPEKVAPAIIAETPKISMTLEDYLKRAESAETYYDLLGVEFDAERPVIKSAYFTLAKSFHPDHYHQEAPELLRRVQDAFTELAKAHETLKNDVTRETYNFKVRKALDEKKKSPAEETPDQLSRQMKQAIDNFERGFSLLMEEEFDDAVPFFARAVHLDPNNARFHAYFGKAMSVDDTKRHKAESELQTALRLDPQNPTYRILLAEFFIQMKLNKRAEGELNRLLTIFPSNREAQALLASLKN
ncbi:MAG: tetratricopeptide repeat protein [Acidobacteriota bacterium]